MSLDINTPRGQQSLAQEQKLIAAIESRYKNYRVFQTPKREPSDVDGVLCREQVIVAVLENKCRDMTLRKLQENFGNEWLVTFDKINRGCAMAKALQVPYVGYLYLIPDDVVLSIKLADKNGFLLPKVRLERTETQETINGGLIIRTNAYVDMHNAKIIGMP